MKKKYSSSWKASKQPRKQRKYRANAPLHVKGKFLHAHLTKTLQKKYETRSVRVVTGDKVKVCRGDAKGKKGEVDRVETKRERIYVRGIDRSKLDGTKAFIPLHPSNIIIEELNTKIRRSFLKTKGAQKKEEKKESTQIVGKEEHDKKPSKEISSSENLAVIKESE